MRIKVGLAQIYPKLGDLAYNLQVHLDYVRQAREQKRRPAGVPGTVADRLSGARSGAGSGDRD